MRPAATSSAEQIVRRSTKARARAEKPRIAWGVRPIARSSSASRCARVLRWRWRSCAAVASTPMSGWNGYSVVRRSSSASTDKSESGKGRDVRQSARNHLRASTQRSRRMKPSSAYATIQAERSISERKRATPKAICSSAWRALEERRSAFATAAGTFSVPGSRRSSSSTEAFQNLAGRPRSRCAAQKSASTSAMALALRRRPPLPRAGPPGASPNTCA
mmetsp:Transcript_1821/g.5290  ORF Transcript_1821/g.5290 Transcript_1821/m.5290 type:complete len:219 (+) Transcript_1821:1993-2649(+)